MITVTKPHAYIIKSQYAAFLNGLEKELADELRKDVVQFPIVIDRDVNFLRGDEGFLDSVELLYKNAGWKVEMRRHGNEDKFTKICLKLDYDHTVHFQPNIPTGAICRDLNGR